MEKKKKQHYVPQLQLRHFAYDRNKEYVWILDKNQKNIRTGRIKDVCEENYFYKIPISDFFRETKTTDKNYEALDDSCFKDTGKHINELTEEEISNLDYSIENYFSDFVEPNLSKFIENIIKCAESNNNYRSIFLPRYFINDDDKHDLSWFISKEYIRTKHHRDRISNVLLQSYKKIIPIMAQFNGIQINENDFTVEYTKEQIKMIHADSILDDKHSETYANVFYSHIWLLFENDTNEPFCCVDNTLMLLPTEEKISFYGCGLASYGITIYIPLSPKYMLVMLDVNKFKEYVHLERTIIKVNSVNCVEQINTALIISSYKYVIFNKESSAKKYKKYCDNNPELYEEASKGKVY